MVFRTIAVSQNAKKGFRRILRNFIMADHLPPVKPFSPLPDRKEYEHLTEEQRKVQGFPHRPLHEDLINARMRVRSLIQRFNTTNFDDEMTRREILDELFHPSCKGKNIFIEQPFCCDYGYNIKVGDNFFANFNCILLDSAFIEFGDDCMLAPTVRLFTATHPVNGAFRKLSDPKNYYELAEPIKVGNNCWLGGGSIICPGVTLGNNVVVGAGAVVTKSFPDNVVIGGNPAKVIRQMPEPELAAEPIWKD